MARVKRGTTSRARHKKILKMAAGYRGRSSSCYRMALQRVEKALQYAYRDRRCRKRDMRALWIQRINAATCLDGMTYSDFIHGLTLLGMDFDRKVLSDMAIHEPASFSHLVAPYQTSKTSVETLRCFCCLSLDLFDKDFLRNEHV